MKTGIIILNYNDYENTTKMLNQIKDYSCLSKIVVVDNCSTDESVEKLKEYENKKIILIQAKKNLGYAAGNNLGLKYLEKETSCEIGIISNPDVIVEESVIKELIHDLKTHDEISFLGPKITEYGRITKGWKLPSYFVEMLSTVNLLHRFSFRFQKYPESHYKERLTEVEVLHGCFFLARMSDFKKIKYFDPNTFLYYEENIIAKKAQMKGLKSYIDNTLTVNHLGAQTVCKNLKKVKKYKAIKKSMFYYEKEYNHLNPIKMFFLKAFYYISLFFVYLTFWI